MSHFIQYGSCGHVIAQCRCMGHLMPKNVERLPEKCLDCQRKEAAK
jgi:hypothetical protein